MLEQFFMAGRLWVPNHFPGLSMGKNFGEEVEEEGSVGFYSGLITGVTGTLRDFLGNSNITDFVVTEDAVQFKKRYVGSTLDALYFLHRIDDLTFGGYWNIGEGGSLLVSGQATCSLYPVSTSLLTRPPR